MVKKMCMGVMLTRSGLLMVNFMCPLDWAKGCPDIWFSIIPGMPVRVFLDEINI